MTRAVSARIRRLVAPTVYTALALAIAYPLLGPGFIFALDHAMGPASTSYYSQFILQNDDPIQSKGGYALLLALLDLVVSTEIAQRIIIFLPFMLAGYGMHRLVASRTESAAYFAGFVYALSAFAYVRAVAGQTGMLWAYALAPWFLMSWFRMRETNSRKALAIAVLLFSATAIFQAHGAFLLLVIVGMDTLVRAVRAPRAMLSTLGAPIVFLTWALLVNAYWIGPVMLAPETTLTHVGEEDRDYFATTRAGLPSVGLAALTLQGFWRENYVSYYADSPALLAVPLIVLLFAVHGVLSRPSDSRRLTVAAAGIIGFVLAVGTASPLTAGVFDFAWDHVPFFKGFRDPHKFLALLALAYAYTAGLGFEDLASRMRRAGARDARTRVAVGVVIGLLLAAPVVQAAPLLRGFDGQLTATTYPSEWFSAEELTRDCDGAMLVLPWHLYIDLPWSSNPDNRATDPAKLFFSCPTFSSDRVEAGAISSPSPVPANRFVDYWLNDLGFARDNPEGIRTIGNLFAPMNIEYFLVLKTADWAGVARNLAIQDDVRLILDNAHVQVFENLAPRATVWRTERVYPIADWRELKELSEAMPLGGALFPMRGELATGTRGGPSPVPVDSTGANFGGGFSVGASNASFLTFAPGPRAPSDGWRFNGAPPALMNLGFAPAFHDMAGGDVERPVTRVVHSATWIISILTVAFLLARTRQSATAVAS